MNQQTKEKTENVEQQERDDAKRPETHGINEREKGLTGTSTDE